MSGWWGGWQADPAVKAAMAAGASQDGWELAEAVALVETVKPQAILEIGADQGGTLLAWRSVCERVYGITLADNSAETGGSGKPLVTFGAQVFIGDSHSAEALLWLTAQLGGGRVLDVAVIDGDHSEPGVYKDLAMYGPLVRPGGLVLLHDITVTTDARAQVHRVWPALADRYLTETITNPEGGYGWGVIRVQDGDEF